MDLLKIFRNKKLSCDLETKASVPNVSCLRFCTCHQHRTSAVAHQLAQRGSENRDSIMDSIPGPLLMDRGACDGMVQPTGQ